MPFPVKPSGRVLIPALVILGIPLTLTVLLWGLYGTLAPPDPNFFARRYPASEEFQQQLEYLRTKGKLSTETEKQLQQAIEDTSDVMEIPPALLWCLFFQESRLNHLLGLDGAQTSHGLGQFTHSGFFEINNELTRINPKNLDHLMHVLGKDVRPIEPRADRPGDPSSYYFIPTAVVSSAIYLKNRYLQLGRVLRSQRVTFDPQLLWLYAIMAYNKGTRSVLSVWNELEQRGGKGLVEAHVQDKHVFFTSLHDRQLFEGAFTRIWETDRAGRYTSELIVHMRNISACSISGTAMAAVGGTGN